MLLGLGFLRGLEGGRGGLRFFSSFLMYVSVVENSLNVNGPKTCPVVIQQNEIKTWADIHKIHRINRSKLWQGNL